MQQPTFIQENVAILKERYGATLKDLYEAYLGSVTAPTTIFSAELTPLEALSRYLIDVKGIKSAEAAKLLGRKKSVVDASHQNAKSKGAAIEENDKCPYRVPLTAFKEGLAPAETICWALREHYNLGNTDIARILGKDPRNTWELLRRADSKRGEKRA